MNSRCQQAGPSPPGFPCLVSVWWLPTFRGVPWPMAASLVSASVVTWPSPLCAVLELPLFLSFRVMCDCVWGQS